MTGTSFAACSVSIAPLRREPSHRSEQTNQLLFGERVLVLEHNPETDWAFVQLRWDGYEGWCKAGQLRAIAAKEYRKEAFILCPDHKGQILLEQGSIPLPAGSELTGIKKNKLPAGSQEGRFKGKKLAANKIVFSAEAMLHNALGYLHSPYQWGGRTLAGIDCSGLVQMAYKICGISVLRDASQQVNLGTEIHFLAETKPGDLAFFDNEDGRIVHVGILLSPDEILHATDTSGRVVIDKIDGAGIVSKSLRRRTHQLRTIRRIEG